MELIKRITSAIFLAVLIALPLALLEALVVYVIVKVYEIPYLSSFQYYQIIGLSFILMMTRNRIKISEKDKSIKDFLPEIIFSSTKRLFRILFVGAVALTIHQLFFK
jgi:hypothetical protein